MIRPRIRGPDRELTCRACCRFRSRHDLPPPRKRRWRWRERAGLCARRRVARCRTRPFPQGASQSPSDRTSTCAPCKAVRRAPSGYHWSQQTSVPSLPALVSRARKPRSPGSEVKLFVVERIVGDVHLAVEAAQRTVAVEDGGGIVIDAGGALFEKGGDEDDSVSARGCGQFFAGRARNRFGQDRTVRDLRAGRSTGSGKVRAGKRLARRAPRHPPCGSGPSPDSLPAPGRRTSGSGPRGISQAARVRPPGSI